MPVKSVSRDGIIEYMKQASYKPMSYEELLDALGSEETEHAFVRTLGRLEKEGEIIKTRKGKYGLPEMMNLVRGTLSMTTKGYAFLIPDEPGAADIFIYGRDLNGAMHSDKVLIRVSRPGHGDSRAEGEVIRVINREHQELVGTYQMVRKVTQVIPDDQRLSVYPIYVKPSRKTP
jgi:ribonuclease R